MGYRVLNFFNFVLRYCCYLISLEMFLQSLLSFKQRWILSLGELMQLLYRMNDAFRFVYFLLFFN